MFTITPMVRELTKHKKELIDEHFSKMLEANDTILKRVDNAMRNSKGAGEGELSVFDKIKGAFKFERTKVLNIPPENMLEYSKDWLNTARENFSTIIQTSGSDYTELQKEIDIQLEIARNELSQVERELNDVNDGEKKTWLQRKKDEITNRSW